MNFIEKIVSYFKGGEKVDDKSLIEAEVCPNCWGKQEYAGEIKEFSEIKDNPSQKAFVAKFVEKHLDGIKLEKNGDVLVCKKCNTKIDALKAA
jgi:protein-arginine kinase activator protein McsA